jgi:hypothetical protein
MAPQESPTPRDLAQRERTPMDTTESSAPHAHLSTEDHDDTVEAHYACLERPCACYSNLGIRRLHRRIRSSSFSRSLP